MSSRADRIVESVLIAAPPARVFEALLDPAQLEQWWTDAECASSDWRIERRVGGDWESSWRWADGRVVRIGGTIRVLEPPSVLEYDWWDERYPGLDRTVVRYELRAVGRSTQLTVSHSGFAAGRADRADYGGGWSRVLGKIAAFAGALS
ncbi:MAG: SRPBCC domain-containing protein [Gemmatimonadales bacterium]